jgi:transketolase
MRAAIFDALFARMATDPTVFFLTADMGLGIVERFEQAYPDRYANVGIAEQNLIGVAAGLCNAGFKPVTYTVSQFYLRAFEQVRNEIGINGAPIVMLGTTEGYDNAPLGPSHHAIDDWGVLKAVPGLDIYCPSSVAYAETLVDQVLAGGRPAYIRIAKGSGVPAVYQCLGDYEYMVGLDPLFVTYGGTLPGDCLATVYVHSPAALLILNKLSPLSANITQVLKRHRRIIVLEDQFSHIGLYSDICQMQLDAEIISLSPSQFDLTVGTSPEVFHKRYGMTLERFVSKETTVA